MKNVLEQIEQLGLVPVVKIDRAEDAVPLAKALCEGGLPCAEVTFRTAAAADAIAAMTAAFPDMLVGAGTVLTPAQADKAMACGAAFIVSPGLNPTVVQHCLDKGYPVVPGVATPSEVEQALSLGLNTVKFFPAEAAGGLPMIKAMSAPYGQLKFMPTGGINAENLTAYLKFPKILACGGSWMVKADLINEGRFDEIRRLTGEAVSAMLGFELVHIGINADDADRAAQIAHAFTGLFGLPLKDGAASFFCSPKIEIMKAPGRGTLGHLAIGTNDATRAAAYLQRRGVALDESTLRRDDSGRIKFVYLQEEIGGFAVHLLQK